MSEDSPTPSVRERNERLMRLATYASVGVALALIVTKFVAWVATDSISLLSTLIDSLLDMAASLLNLLAVRHALQPADEEHRFGHGKAESLSGLAQAAFICGSALFLFVEASSRLYHPAAIVNTTVGYVVMVFSILTTLVLVWFQRHVVRRTGSLAISADSTHYQMDILINFSVIVSLALSQNLGWVYADPVFAIGISAYIIYGAYQIGYEALHVLMDRELPDDARARIREIVLGHPGVSDMHDLRTRKSGPDVFIQMHIEMDGKMSLRRAHDISEDVMRRVATAFPNAEVLIHEDPEGIDEERPSFAVN
ncbi:cation diffusion facilitator family transporter [Varunaivibrio sulfuroxidans]|uniref:Cation-efflux pump FieF n=1 Tax=Varunaivibrio sulfuroxidans TaxID=1773489 RepID=A0A4R3J3C5_9PROT|nr:cation diffusion facilitator family transporter [Varunaivibrio sulfuroxidans]TCS60339.1 ferrous-iron efflux pump FieF [Varunaivibrio sulfuroxidans]WES30973.1 cation diffusion facilitator family transporter [Varunaivibrio sulfuroxidans]